MFIPNIYCQCPVPDPIGVDLLQSSGKTSVQITVICDTRSASETQGLDEAPALCCGFQELPGEEGQYWPKLRSQMVCV